MVFCFSYYDSFFFLIIYVYQCLHQLEEHDNLYDIKALLYIISVSVKIACAFGSASSLYSNMRVARVVACHNSYSS